MNILDDLLEKRKKKSPEDLTESAKRLYYNWKEILDKEIAVEDIKKFLNNEIQRLETEWMETETKNPVSYLLVWKKEIYLKARIKNYKAIVDLINTPEKNKERLTKYIKHNYF